MTVAADAVARAKTPAPPAKGTEKLRVINVVVMVKLIALPVELPVKLPALPVQVISNSCTIFMLSVN